MNEKGKRTYGSCGEKGGEENTEEVLNVKRQRGAEEKSSEAGDGI